MKKAIAVVMLLCFIFAMQLPVKPVAVTAYKGAPTASMFEDWMIGFGVACSVIARALH